MDLKYLKKTTTKSRVLAAVKQFGVISIKSISAYCNLSIPIVSQHVESMLKDGLLKEQTKSVVSPGRKPKLLSINPDYGYIVGVEFGLLGLAKTGIFTLDGVLINNASVYYDENWQPEDIINNVMYAIEKQFIDFSLNKEKILYIVIGNPGVVNPETGSIVLSARSAKWSELPLKYYFQNFFNVTVEVLNDVNLSAIGEKSFGAGHAYSNFIFIRQTIGLKAGIVLKNRLYQGESFAAGEIGCSIINVPEKGKIIRTTAESYLSIPTICERIANRLINETDDIFYSITGGNPKNVTVDNIVKALGKPSYVNSFIQEAGEMFGYLLVNVVAALDIALIIISGDVTKFNNYYFKPVREILSENLESPPTVLVSSLGDDVALYGAFSVGQESFLSSIQ